MKKIKILLAIFALSYISCEKDGGESKIDLQVGATPLITKVAGTDQGINYASLNAGSGLKIGITVAIATGDVVSMNIVGLYTKGTVTTKGILKSNITSFPSNLTITETDLFNAYSFLNVPGDVALTDKLTISADMTLGDGRIIKIYNDNASNNFSSGVANLAIAMIAQDYVVSCPLTNASIFNGNYKVTVDDWADYSVGSIIPIVYDTANGLLKFRLLNSANTSTLPAFASNYLECTVNPTNNTVSVVSNAPYVYGAGAANSFTASGTGTVASCTGDLKLVLKWTRSSGSFEDQKFNLIKQ